ncbi:MAG: hypothetical protein A2381_03350 [Bdellovibrionales bacterium RIFOXYB1_FULL_37_110]|nr:MAG: hypothetical protein A2181_00455 [Bdellovibrionales bacterium RIFOXYA1_FULL_38_20]OFZ48441.1 MAG: hypothetical protein A2417_03840 [Bdellovibrionales bacterium RIFOXYC1_FULL_37_79]OFZ57962.1 MAG: hypothetical protein A2381_03350 [Bdellovibrionales bacterium RIFOXYB1_FULL_37_110]OFZ63099.1 MAG: hypothetical protein A2577_15480 [Bdellovibrionales bacterium RIFOXYD1_FULL_36_51]
MKKLLAVLLVFLSLGVLAMEETTTDDPSPTPTPSYDTSSSPETISIDETYDPSENIEYDSDN